MCAYSTGSNPSTEKQKQPTKHQGHFNQNNEKENSIAIVYHINSLKNMVVYTQNPSSQDKGEFEANLHCEILTKKKKSKIWTEEDKYTHRPNLNKCKQEFSNV